MALSEQERLIKTLNERLANVGRTYGKDSYYYRHIVDYYEARKLSMHESKSGFKAIDYNQRVLKESNEAYMDSLRRAAGYTINKDGSKSKVQGLNTVASIRARARESLKESGVTEARLRKKVREAHPEYDTTRIKAEAHKEYENLVSDEIDVMATISEFLNAHEEVAYKYRVADSGDRSWKNEDIESIYEAVNSGRSTDSVYAMIQEYEAKYRESKKAVENFDPYSEEGKAMYRK